MNSEIPLILNDSHRADVELVCRVAVQFYSIMSDVPSDLKIPIAADRALRLIVESEKVVRNDRHRRTGETL